jgi:hypothetical protein
MDITTYWNAMLFGSRHFQIFREVADLERGLLSLVSTVEELTERYV